MTNRNVTKIEENMQEMLDKLDPESNRFKILLSAKRFKSNWLDLGELLQNLIKSEEFSKWGFQNFEAYCKAELKIKLDTAMKLVSSYGFLKKYKPELTKGNNLNEVPDFKVINKLAQVEENLEVDNDVKKDLRNSVFDEGMTYNSLNKKLKEVSGEPEEKMNDDEQIVEKMRKSLYTLRKCLPVFDADDNILESLKTIEDFISTIEV